MSHNLASALAGVSLIIGAASVTHGEAIKLVPGEVATGDRYGSAVSMWKTLAVVGAPLDDENGADAGAVFLLRRDCSAWVVDKKILHEQVVAGDQFGSAVEIRDDLLVVGADAGAGAAYVFRLHGDDWLFEQKLLPDPAVSRRNFGAAVAIGVDVIVVGADEDDENGTDSGATYVFRFDGKGWAREQKLLASDGEAFDFFGRSVAIDGDTCLIGSPLAFATGSFAGAVYRFHFNGTTWVEEQKLMADDGGDGDGFGSSVAFDSATTVVGSPLDNGTGIDDSGSAYVFGSDALTWVQLQKLLPPKEAAFDRFGFSVALSGETLVIGSPGDLDQSSTPGAADVFRFDEKAWAWERTLAADDGAPQDGWGWSIGFFGDGVALGTPMDDAAAGSMYVDFIGPISEGDVDVDGDTDLIDFVSFASCITGPNPAGAIPEECTVFDFDVDGDVDLSDLATFQRAFACGN